MRYEKALGQHDFRNSPKWGSFVIYVEWADDLFLFRAVSLYENGNALRYDRERWVDDFGMLGEARYRKSSKNVHARWTVLEITQDNLKLSGTQLR